MKNLNKSEILDLSTCRKKNSSNEIKVRDYVDSEGYNVIEAYSPDTHIKIRYNESKNYMEYKYNFHTEYSGPIDKSFLNGELNAFEQSLIDFDADFAKFDEWNRRFDKIIEEMPTFPSTYQTYSSNYNNAVKRNQNSGCLGCLVITIAFIIAICLILYGMVFLGGWIIDFITKIF